MAGGIFISYRREDAAAEAGRLHDHLLADFPSEQLFMDVDAIEPGLDFIKVLNERVETCDVLIAIIGKGWLAARDAKGTPRLADPADFVRIEIEAALSRNKRVIPILVDGASLPVESDLPEGLKELARRQAIEFPHARFGAEADRLAEMLKRSFNSLGDTVPKPAPGSGVGFTLRTACVSLGLAAFPIFLIVARALAAPIVPLVPLLCAVAYMALKYRDRLTGQDAAWLWLAILPAIVATLAIYGLLPALQLVPVMLAISAVPFIIARWSSLTMTEGVIYWLGCGIFPFGVTGSNDQASATTFAIAFTGAVVLIAWWLWTWRLRRKAEP